MYLEVREYLVMMKISCHPEKKLKGLAKRKLGTFTCLTLCWMLWLAASRYAVTLSLHLKHNHVFFLAEK
jgi:hypothetical protein